MPRRAPIALLSVALCSLAVLSFAFSGGRHPLNWHVGVHGPAPGSGLMAEVATLREQLKSQRERHAAVQSEMALRAEDLRRLRAELDEVRAAHGAGGDAAAAAAAAELAALRAQLAAQQKLVDAAASQKSLDDLWKELRDEEGIRMKAVEGLRAELQAGVPTPSTPVPPLAVQGIDYYADYAVPGEEGDTAMARRYDDLRHNYSGLHYPDPALGKQDPRYRFVLLSHRPKIFYFPHFMSDEECDELAKVSQQTMSRSVVVPYRGSNGSGIDDVRTSTQGYVSSANPTCRNVSARVERATRWHRGVSGFDQVLRYEVGQKYESHYDYFDPHFYGARNSNRAVTVFLYLNTVEEGGETVFLRANGGGPVANYKDCARGLRVRPRKGAVVIFYDMRPDGSLDEWSLHGGCPVKKGLKLGGTIWLSAPAAPV